VVAPDASAGTSCSPSPSVSDPPCVQVVGSTPDCKICHSGEWCSLLIVQSKPITAAMTVSYATIDGTAVSGVDFAGICDGRTTIPAGSTRSSFTVQVFRSLPGTPSKIFYAVLTGVSTGTIGNSRVEVHIPASR
jgi:hypothetical protein